MSQQAIAKREGRFPSTATAVAGYKGEQYHHPYGNSSPTLAHRDHVHVSYAPPK